MDEIEENVKPKHVRETPLTRYYSTLQLLSHPSSRLHLLSCFYQISQVMTLLLPPTEDWNIPWNYTVFWPAWLFLNCGARVDQLLTVLKIAPETVTLFFLTCLSTRLISAITTGAYLWSLPKEEYRRITEEKYSNFWAKNLLKADRTSHFVFSNLCGLPLISFLTSVLTCAHPTVCLATSSIVWMSSLALTTLLAAMLVIVCDKVGACDVRWEKNSATVSKPSQQAMLTVVDISTAFSQSFLAFAAREAYRLAFAFSLGLLRVVYIYKEVPYHLAVYNAAGSFQGAVLVCEAGLLCISLLFDKSAIMPSLSLFLLLPMVACYIYTQFRRAKKRRGYESDVTEWHQELQLRDHLITGTPEKITPRSIGLWSHSSSTLGLVWSAYFYLQKEDTFCMKMLIAQLSFQRLRWVNAIPFAVCLRRMQIAILSNAEEKVIHDFLMYTRLQEKVINSDFHSTVLLRSFYEKLLHRHVLFQELSSTAQVLSESLQYTLSTYKKILQNFKQKKTLLQSYCSLLETLGKRNEASKCHSLIAKIGQPQQKRHIIEGIEFLQFDNPKAIILVVQCTGPCSGTVTWAVNAAALGYSDEGIRGLDFNLLIPQGFRPQHQDLMADFRGRTEVPTVFRTTTDLYFVTQQNHLLYGSWRILLANEEPAGHLALISVIRIRRPVKEFCVISEERKLMERTVGFDQFLLETDFLTAANFDADKVWTGTWRREPMYVRKDKWTIGSVFHLKIISLVKDKNGKSVTMASSGEINLMSSMNFMSSKLHQRSYSARVKSLYESGTQKTTNTHMTSHTSSLKSLYTQSILKENRPYLRLLLINIVALFAICMSLNIVVMKQISNENYTLNQNIGEMQSLRMRTNSVLSSLRSKELFLLNAGYTVFTNENKSRADLAAIGLQLNEMAGYLMGNASKQTGLFRSLLLEPMVPFWKHELDSFKLYHLSLINLMVEMATHASALATAPLSNITTSNSDFMTLYRNGAVEGLHAFNMSVKVFAEQKNDERNTMGESLRNMVISSLVIQLCMSVVLTVPLLFLIERWRRKLWTLILQMPKQLLAEMLHRIYTRLINLHEAEDLAAYLGSDDKPPMMRSGRYTMSLPMQRLLMSVTFFLVFINLSVYLVYYIGVIQNQDILLDKPKYIHWAGLRRVLPWLAMHYMREAYVPWNLSFANIVKESQVPYAPFEQWRGAISELNYLHYCLTYGCSKSNLQQLFLSDSSKDLLLGSPCSNCTAHARYGLTPLVHELIYAQETAYTAFLSGNSSYSPAKAVEKEVSLIGPYLLDAVGRYDNETLSLLSNAEAMTGIISAAFIIVAFLAFATTLLPLISKVSVKQTSKMLERELQILKNIESVDQSEA